MNRRYQILNSMLADLYQHGPEWSVYIPDELRYEILPTGTIFPPHERGIFLQCWGLDALCEKLGLPDTEVREWLAEECYFEEEEWEDLNYEIWKRFEEKRRENG